MSFPEENMNLFLRIIESSVPVPLNNDYEIDFTDEQKSFIKSQHLAVPINTTLMLVSLDNLIDNYEFKKGTTIDNSLKDITAGLHLTNEDKEYIIQKLVSKLIN